MLNKDAPIICAECDKVEIHGRDLYCTEKHRTVYGSKPKWCPYPVWDDSVTEGQMTLFDYMETEEDVI